MARFEWIEVWIDSASKDYFLILRCQSTTEFMLIDPQQDKRQIVSFSSYEEASHWLNEDEYDLIEGRYPATDD